MRYEVRVRSLPNDNECGYETMAWLEERGYPHFTKSGSINWDINMLGGRLDYVIFEFDDRHLAILTRLTWG